MRRRGNNEGSIYQRKDGAWCGQVTVNGHRLTKYARTRKEIQVWIKTTLEQVDKGLTAKGARTTIEEFLVEWLKMKENEVKPNTIATYRIAINNFIVPAIGNQKIGSLRPEQVQVFYNSLDSRGIAVIISAVMHGMYRQAIQWGMVGKSPLESIVTPRHDKKEMQTLTSDQVRTLLASIKGTRLECLVYIAVTTGMRKGELLGLKWSDVDWERGVLMIQRQLIRIPNLDIRMANPKTKSGQRMISIGKGGLDMLKEHLKVVETIQALAGSKWQENDLIFPNYIGRPMEPGNMVHEFKKALDAAGLPDVRFHDLRHTSATLALQQGVHPRIVQERLGHSDITMTLRTYSHVMPSMQKEAADKLEELIAPITVELQYEDGH